LAVLLVEARISWAESCSPDEVNVQNPSCCSVLSHACAMQQAVDDYRVECDRADAGDLRSQLDIPKLDGIVAKLYPSYCIIGGDDLEFVAVCETCP
jgi:hypothetical protein